MRKQTEVMTVSLESIYVPLFTQERQGGRIPRGGELGGMLVQGEKGEPIPLTAFLPRHRCLVVVGEAGSGKSTFMRHVALTLAPLGGFGLFVKEIDEARKAVPNTGLIVEYL